MTTTMHRAQRGGGAGDVVCEWCRLGAGCSGAAAASTPRARFVEAVSPAGRSGSLDAATRRPRAVVALLVASRPPRGTAWSA
eukprot:CAMPEP_0185708410 /NCGR_PEP_ID=MMETSP1164-20130828/26528_1 /TAXON_ID=1104430 /ORGANISM="Chrysoreinhardia sp, Strain CCMP2950" /LENGTH=81 /DNA_ID=CAMNT_0028375867 /DNA_START=359 /DNA_END=601 /DNA_ORIENTATION=+